ncbi:hypothetical protein SLH46_21580, partial [Draconibacterium sp. IB214405]|uniref:hypothetical protein n=1 Tax=Draconibacterium sp. IB214405 TaxID=3097352 RepID=UPI002A124BBF
SESVYQDYIYYSNPIMDKNLTFGHGYERVEISHNYMRSGSPSGDALKSYKEVKSFNLLRLNNTIVPKLTEVKLIDGNSNLVKRIENTYIEGTSTTQVDGWSITEAFAREGLVSGCDVGEFFEFSGETYYGEIYKDIHCTSHGTVILDKTTTVDYFNSAADSIKVLEDFDYNTNLQVERVTKDEDNQKETLLTYITYPDDYPTDNTLITLNNNHLVGLPVTITQKRKINSTEYVSNKRKYLYDTSGNIIKDYNFDDGYSDDLDLNNEITYLSGTKKIREIKSPGSEYVTYLWSYGKTKPVAKIENASYSAVSSKTGASLISNLENATTQSSIDSYLSQVRSSLSSLSNILVTTYKYRPLFGIDEVIDPTGVKTSYTYDEYGRLLEVKNDDSQILNRYQYNYK